MDRDDKTAVANGALFLAALLFSSPVFGAQNLAIATYQRAESAGPEPGVLITQKVAEASLVRLAGNTRPEANAANNRGPVAPEFPMEHMLLQLRRPPEHEQALENYLNEVQDTKSPNYHHWLTAQQIGQQYGLPAQDLDAITGWLKSHGFIINKLYPSGVVIDFSGIAAGVSEAFHTEIHHLDVKGERHVANVSDPQIPAALAPAVVGVVSLNDFRPRPQYRSRPSYTYNNCSGTVAGGTCYAVVPADLATIYNLAPLFTGGTSGKGQTIVVAEDSDVYSPSDWDTFRSTYGLSAFPAGSFTQEHPGCADPGIAADEAESILDAEWASAAAPSAAIVVASCMGTGATSGVLLAVENVLSSGTPADVLSISYGEPESVIGATGNAFIESLYQQAAAEGVSVFVAAGDQGAAGAENPSTFESNGLSVSGYSSTPYNVAVGATDFGNEYAGSSSTYWSNTNGKYGGSALSYVPEIPWNDSCASGLIATFLGYSSTYGSGGLCNSSGASTYQLLDITAGGGGPSGCATGSATEGTCAGYAKPAWQSLLGIPNDGVRDLPDVSMFGADGVWGNSYVICDSDPADFGGGCLTGWGGTSFGAPIMAGIQALVNQQTGSRQGNPNPVYYSLAAAEAGYGTSGSPCNSLLGNQAASSCIFYDVTEGDIDVPCIGSHNCYVPSGTYGVLSISNSAFQPAYLAAPGWDFATGIGTLNAYNLAMGFPTSTATASATATTTGTATQTPTATSTATPTPTATATATPTATVTATASTTATVTATPTATATPTSTATRTSTATASATATTTGSATRTPTATSTATLTPTATATATATATPTPSMGRISVSTNPITLKAKPGKRKSKKLKVTNIGTGPLNLIGTGLSEPLSSSGGGTIAPKKRLVITITDAPLTGGSTVTQTLKILSNDPTRSEVDIRVNGNSP